MQSIKTERIGHGGISMKVSVSKIDTFQNTAKFKQPPFTQESYLQVEGKLKSKNPRIIVERKNGYIRKYLLKADGTKTLISEVRLNDTVLKPESSSLIPSHRKNNAKEMLDLLNASSTLKSIRLKN